MNIFRKIISTLCGVMMFLCNISPVYAEGTGQPGTAVETNGQWTYTSMNEGAYTFEKVTHPDRGAGEVDGFLDEVDSRSQSYAWSAIEYGDYIYVGTCYNSTYGIYYRAVMNMMIGLGKTQAEAMQIARDFVQFVFDEKFDETLKPRGVIIKINKKTNVVSLVYDSSADTENGLNTNRTSGYRMAFEFQDRLYFVSLGSPSMFLLEITPEDNGNSETCAIAYKRTLGTEGKANRIAAGVHGLIVYDNEILMCLAGEKDEENGIPEGGRIIASSDARNWRVIADEDDLGPSAYHEYDGLMGGGIWDIIEYNGHVYVTVVTDLTDVETGIVNKQGFALYRGTKQEDDSFTWEMMAGDTSKEGVVLPYGFGTTYSMACNMWVYDDHLYLGTYNDPMLDFTAVAERGDFKDLYYDLFYSINLYRMDKNENFELIAGRENDVFTEVRGNMGPGFGDCANQYVWRMTEHDGKLWIGTYDASVLAGAFTQLTDGQLLDMSEEQYLKRLAELKKLAEDFGIVKEKYGRLFDIIFGSEEVQYLFNAIQKLVDAGTGDTDPVPYYEQVLKYYQMIKDRTAGTYGIMNNRPIGYRNMMNAVNELFFRPMDQLLNTIGKTVYYFGTNYYMKHAVKGFDILITEDGINFEVITNDGFGDENNHGVRTLTSADEGNTLYVGTANPYYGGQMWRTVPSGMAEMPEAPDGEEISAMQIPFVITCENNADHEYKSSVNGADVTCQSVQNKDGEISVTGEMTWDNILEQYVATYNTHVTEESMKTDLTFTWNGEKWECDDELTLTVKEPAEPSRVIEFRTGNEGTAERSSIIVDETIPLSAQLPEVHTIKGFRMLGWSIDGSTVLSDEELDDLESDEPLILYAVYEETVQVEFRCDAFGAFTDHTVFTLTKGTGLSQIPVIDIQDGYHFAGWKINDETYENIDDLLFDEDTVITAVVHKDNVTPPEIEMETVTVTFEAGDHGTLYGSADVEINAGESLRTIPVIHADEGYAMIGWQYGEETYTDDQILSMKINENMTLTAVYETVEDTDPIENNRPDTPVTSDTDRHEAVNTSDSTNLAMYGGIGIGALVLAVLVVLLRRKENR